MHHMQGLEIEKRKESPESLFSINVADKKKKKINKSCFVPSDLQ